MRPWSRGKKEKESPNPIFLTPKIIEILENTFKDIFEYLKFLGKPSKNLLCNRRAVLSMSLYILANLQGALFFIFWDQRKQPNLFHSPFLFIKL